jgi:thiosulfate/3-mercaptopyruvate sulfurtransferase
MKSDAEPYGTGRMQWVSTAWLARHLSDVKLIDVQPDVHDYIAGHIPGAVHLNENSMKSTYEGLPARYLSPEHMPEIMGRAGIAPFDPALVYTGRGEVTATGDGLEQYAFAYLLLRFGHKQVYLLDGGLDKWTAEHRPSTKELPKVIQTRYSPVVDETVLIRLDEFLKIKDDSNTVLLDARKPDVYSGDGGIWLRKGHIPGAVNLPWFLLVNPDNKTWLKPVEEVKKLVEQVGTTKGKLIICSCGTGRSATVLYAIIKHLLECERVRLYEGSFLEWSADAKRPVVKGHKPR